MHRKKLRKWQRGSGVRLRVWMLCNSSILAVSSYWVLTLQERILVR